tara:strand:- start:26 stop:364 length:339 start_codon:yes stop_codon:yes gene_type:complete
MRQRKTTKLPILFFIVLPLLSGCGTVAGALGASPLATQILNGIGWTTTVIDVPRVIEDKPTINESILSEIVEKDCRFKRVLENRKLCIENAKRKAEELSKSPELQWITPPDK